MCYVYASGQRKDVDGSAGVQTCRKDELTRCRIDVEACYVGTLQRDGCTIEEECHIIVGRLAADCDRNAYLGLCPSLGARGDDVCATDSGSLHDIDIRTAVGVEAHGVVTIVGGIDEGVCPNDEMPMGRDDGACLGVASCYLIALGLVEMV